MQGADVKFFAPINTLRPPPQVMYHHIHLIAVMARFMRATYGPFRWLACMKQAMTFRFDAFKCLTPIHYRGNSCFFHSRGLQLATLLYCAS
jgi:hypothetical protein